MSTIPRKSPSPIVRDDLDAADPKVIKNINHDQWTGRFKPGNKARVGKTGINTQIALLRQSVLKRVDEEQLARIVDAVVRKAEKGHLGAFMLLWDRLMGKPAKIDVREVDEIRMSQYELSRKVAAHESIARLDSAPLKRQRILTPELIEDLALFIGEGIPVDGACDLAKLNHERFRQWFKTGAELEGSVVPGRKFTEDEQLKIDLVVAVRQAIARYRFKVVAGASERSPIEVLQKRDSRNFGEQQEDTGAVYSPDDRFL